MALTGLLLVDGDGHTVEPKDLWVARMDAKRWGDWIPRTVMEGEVEAFYVGGVCRGGGLELTAKLAGELGMTLAEWKAMLASLERPGGFDPHARVQDLDLEGLDAAVVYPTMSLFYGPNDENLYKLAMSVLRGEQEWLEKGIVADNCEMGINEPVVEPKNTTTPKPELAGVL